ncbi:WAT1-related protein At5g64700-like [Magnolia sinica]|uniref:WAT1-related protein At5g64700-like n=1 Tax=Magnolia sinica TaxID=86752 RepID=UPI002659480A|nr:WAT1-related protein At5g64700-like [Magnolia sinica]
MVTMKDCGLYAAMIFVQLAYGGSSILSKLALQKGLSSLVFIVYRHIIAMLIFGPFAYFVERKQRPPLSVPILLKIFFLASLGITIHLNLFYLGLDYSSATVAGALSNVIPGLTFLLAVLLRMEKLQMRSVRGRVKLFGTLTCIGGALIFTLWKGYLFKGFVRSPLINIHGKDFNGGPRHIKDNWIKGSALILTSNVAFSGWLILQAKVYEVYPARLSINTLMCFFASLQCSVVAIAFDRKTASWRLDWNVQLLAIVYCGIVISALVYYLHTWCISEKGPVFNAMFSPLLLVVVGIFSALVFAERLHLGSVIGAFLIIVGLYCVLWGKREDVVASQMEGKQGKDRSPTNQISMENLSNQISANEEHVIVPVMQAKSGHV